MYDLRARFESHVISESRVTRRAFMRWRHAAVLPENMDRSKPQRHRRRSTQQKPRFVSASVNVRDHRASPRVMAQAPAENRLPVYFLGHAGVGLLFRESEENNIVQGNLRDLGEEIRRLRPKPKAIIVFSGHFEAGEIHGPGVIEVNVKKHSHIQVSHREASLFRR